MRSSAISTSGAWKIERPCCRSEVNVRIGIRPMLCRGHHQLHTRLQSPCEVRPQIWIDSFAKKLLHHAAISCGPRIGPGRLQGVLHHFLKCHAPSQSKWENSCDETFVASDKFSNVEPVFTLVFFVRVVDKRVRLNHFKHKHG